MTMRASLSFAPVKNSSLTFQARYLDEENDETQVTPWEGEATELGAYFWWMPKPTLYAVASAQVSMQEQDTHVCIPLMGG